MIKTEAEGDIALERRWAVIRPKLEANARWLGDQGGLVRTTLDGRPAWVVRFKAQRDGRSIHRSIYVGVGDPEELLDRVRRLLACYRSEGSWLKGLDRLARTARQTRRIALRVGCRVPTNNSGQESKAGGPSTPAPPP